MNKYLYILSFVYLTACSTQKKTGFDPTQIAKFSLTKGVCKGQCSQYNISVYKDFRIVYEGLANVDRYGIFERKLSKNELLDLETAYQTAKFMSMLDQYPVDISDFPLIVMTYTKDKKTKKVEGRTERPKELLDLQHKLEALTSTGTWTTIKEYPINETNVVKPNEVVQGDQILNQIIIEPNPNVAFGPWLREQKKYGINLMKKISPNLNLWLISFNSDLISPPKMLEILKADPIIKSAEFNSVVSPR